MTVETNRPDHVLGVAEHSNHVHRPLDDQVKTRQKVLRPRQEYVAAERAIRPAVVSNEAPDLVVGVGKSRR